MTEWPPTPDYIPDVIRSTHDPQLGYQCACYCNVIARKENGRTWINSYSALLATFKNNILQIITVILRNLCFETLCLVVINQHVRQFTACKAGILEQDPVIL